jgi:predicted DNA-binding transcriptional regulator AlpA
VSENPLSQDVLIRAVDLKARFGGISDMTIHRWTVSKDFPKSVKLGGRDRFWRKTEVDAWIAARESEMVATVTLSPAADLCPPRKAR